MKIRTDFVTNSSSSSFCTIHISGSKLAEILKKYKSLFDSHSNITITDEEFSYTGENDELDCCGPKGKNEMASCFVNFISEFAECCDESEMFDSLINELENNKKEINKTISSFKLELRVEGYGGDSDSRFWYDYDDEDIRMYMGLDEKEEITEEIKDNFLERIADAGSLETTTWTYNGKRIKVTNEFDLLF